MSRLGSTPTQDERQALFEDAYSQLHRLHANWRLYVTLFGDPEAVRIIRRAARFTFGEVQRLLIEAIVLRIDQLLESAGRGKPASIATLISWMPREDAPLNRGLRKRLEDLRRSCASLSVHRDRLIAHRELDVVLLKDEMPQLYTSTIRHAITELSIVLDMLSQKYFGGMSCVFSPDEDPDTFDADVLLGTLGIGQPHVTMPLDLKKE